MKRCLSLLLSVLLLLTLCACGGEQPAVQPQPSKPDDTLQIGMSFDSFVIERWQRDRDVFISAAREQGAEVLVQVAGGDVGEQIEQIRYLIKKGVDALVIVAVDSTSLADVVEEAKLHGIYVVSYDRLISDTATDLFISFDSRRVGSLMGEQLARSLRPNANVICLHGSASDDNVTQMRVGFLEAAKQAHLNVIYEDYCPNWEAQTAYDLLQPLLDQQLPFDGVMCGNDDLASMVYKALAERGLASSVCIVGQDAELSACQRIVSGWQSMTVYKPVELMARCAAEETVRLIRTGKTSTEETIPNGSYEVPCILLEPTAVTAENMDEVIISGGFHLRGDVYGEREEAEGKS